MDRSGTVVVVLAFVVVVVEKTVRNGIGETGHRVVVVTVVVPCVLE